MKKLLSSITLLLLMLNVYAQNDKTYVNTYPADNPDWKQDMKNICNSCNETYKYFLNFACYNKKPIALANLVSSQDNIMKSTQVMRTSVADTQKGEGSTSEILVGGIQPLGWGYHFLKMDPFNPQTRGTNGSYSIFTIRGENLTNDNKDFYYYSQDQKTNFPKYLFFDSNTTSRMEAGEFTSNSARSFSKTNTYSFGVEGGYGEIFECSANTEVMNKITEARSENSIYSEARQEQMYGTWVLTDYAVMSRDYIDALNALPTSYNSSTKQQFLNFFDKYGTHYAAKTDYGARQVDISKYTASEIAKATSSSVSVDVSASGSVKKVKIGATASAALERERNSQRENSKKIEKSYTVGKMSASGVSEAAPVGVTLRSVSLLCDAFLEDRSTWDARKAAIDNAIKALNNESKASPASSEELFVTTAEVNQIQKPEYVEENKYYRMSPYLGSSFQLDHHGHHKEIRLWDKVTDHNQKFYFTKVKDAYGKPVMDGNEYFYHWKIKDESGKCFSLYDHFDHKPWKLQDCDNNHNFQKVIIRKEAYKGKEYFMIYLKHLDKYVDLSFADPKKEQVMKVETKGVNQHVEAQLLIFRHENGNPIE